ncbi:MAG: hypothetical protein ABEI80_00770 [Haloplanus sp.]
MTAPERTGRRVRTDGGAADTLTRTVVDDLAAEYENREPFDLVEREHMETLPSAFAAGEFGRRDAEWVVQWYYRRRRRVGALSDAERRAAESQFQENDYEAMVDAIQGAANAASLDEKLDRLTALIGVDVPVASAFLAFTQPDDYVTVGPREWRGLREAGALSDPYPTPVTADAYERYLDAVRTVADRTERDLWTVYRAVWRFGAE